MYPGFRTARTRDQRFYSGQRARPPALLHLESASFLAADRTQKSPIVAGQSRYRYARSSPGEAGS